MKMSWMTCCRYDNGNPAWHPSGEYIVFTSENEDVPKKYDALAKPSRGASFSGGGETGVISYLGIPEMKELKLDLLFMTFGCLLIFQQSREFPVLRLRARGSL